MSAIASFSRTCGSPTKQESTPPSPRICGGTAMTHTAWPFNAPSVRIRSPLMRANHGRCRFSCLPLPVTTARAHVCSTGARSCESGTPTAHKCDWPERRQRRSASRPAALLSVSSPRESRPKARARRMRRKFPRGSRVRPRHQTRHGNAPGVVVRRDSAPASKPSTVPHDLSRR